MEYSTVNILDESIFKRFKLSESAQEFYANKLDSFAKNKVVLDKICNDLAESSKFVPTITDIKNMYRDLTNHKKEDRFAPSILTELQQKEASKVKNIFFNIRQTMIQKKMRYNDACLELLLDKSWYIDI